jgi:hypothetical protein
MQKQQALQCNAEAAGATQKSRSRRRNIVMQKQQALHCNTEAAGTIM